LAAASASVSGARLPGNEMKRRWCLVLALCGAAFPISAWAHDPGLSSAHLTVSQDTINAVAIFNARDLVTLTNDGANYTAIAPELLRVGIGGKQLSVNVGKRSTRIQN
jgi:hypothetical protein